MMPTDKANDLLLALGNADDRRTRAGEIDLALRTALALTEADAAIILTSKSRRAERLLLHAGSPAAAMLTAPNGSSEVLRAFESAPEPRIHGDLSEDPAVLAADGCPGVDAGPAIFAALRSRETAAPGYLAVYRRRGRPRFTAADRRSMLLITAWLGVALECQRRASGVQKLTLTDDLTDVYNARFLRAALRRELRRAGRFGQELSIVLVEVEAPGLRDAEPGELRSSMLLRELALLLAREVRSFDLLARYRKDRFVLMLPETGRAGAQEVAARIRAATAQHVFSSRAAGEVTLRTGVSSFPEAGAEPASLFAAAERALLEPRVERATPPATLAHRAA